MPPMVETSATAEPVTPPKNIEATQTICASAPGSQPTSTSAIMHQTPRDAAARHQHAGEHEEDHRQQREGVDRRQHALDDGGVVDAGQQEGGDDAGDADRERNRQADER